MNRRCSKVVVALTVASLTVVISESLCADQTNKKPTIQFDRDIRPILTEKCLSCHGRDEPKAGLRLSDRAGALAGGESGAPAIVPGKPDESEFLKRIATSDIDVRMPPREKEPLKPEEVAKLRAWIADGANWTDHWAFEFPSSPKPPEVQATSQVKNDIDRFVIAKLESLGIAPSPVADRHVLIRRLNYDLLGLPPTPEEVDAFINDSSPEAYSNLVERLLKSEHFGERWGRHWLDLAHYADSDGYEKDRARPDAHIYRDWVIDAFNQNMPFDQFTVEQLAGDLLPASTPRQKIATAFLRQTLTNEEGGVDQEEYRVAAVFDRTETVGTVWLGLTVGCVRCHSHKYDPIPHDDYYRLFAFFNNSEEVTSKLAIQADNLEALSADLAPLEERLRQRHASLAKDCLAWETEQHRIILSQPTESLREHSLQIVDVTSAAPATQFVVDGDSVRTLLPNKDTYTVTAATNVERITGFKLTVLPDDKLPNKGPGQSDNGNFVITGLRVFVQTPGQPSQTVELHRASADFSQKDFSPDAVLASGTDGKSGWAIAPKTGESHWIQVRTRGPLTLSANSKLRFVLDQQFGDRHTIGKFKLEALTGEERGLHISNKEIASSLEMYPEKRVANVKQSLFNHYVRVVVHDEECAQLEQQISSVHQKYRAQLTDVRSMSTPRLPRQTYVFDRGEFLSKKNEVSAGTLSVLPPITARGESPDRLDLARWLVSDENPLVPRVAVNHIWSRLFGQGLVKTPSDLGVRGEPPSHPELLDWLVHQFRRDFKWDRKDLIRLIVHSATYRQSSHYRSELDNIDPSNSLLARQNRFRIEAEVVRDLALAASGLLSPKIGGPSVFPQMPDDLAKLSYANSFTWTNSEGSDRFRRGMYTFFKRTIPHPNLTTFDCPDANVACVARTVSNTPLQALTLLNNESHIEAAQALAKRVLTEQGTEAMRVERLLRYCVARPATSRERDALTAALSAARLYYSSHKDDSGKIVGKITVESVAESELAAWVATARIVLNLDEFITRE